MPEGIKGMVKIVEYETKITVYQKHRKLIEYALPDWDVKNVRFAPEEYKHLTKQPNNRKKDVAKRRKSCAVQVKLLSVTWILSSHRNVSSGKNPS